MDIHTYLSVPIIVTIIIIIPTIILLDRLFIIMDIR